MSKGKPAEGALLYPRFRGPRCDRNCRLSTKRMDAKERAAKSPRISFLIPRNFMAVPGILSMGNEVSFDWKNLTAPQSRCAVVLGEAGSGKSWESEARVEFLNNHDDKPLPILNCCAVILEIPILPRKFPPLPGKKQAPSFRVVQLASLDRTQGRSSGQGTKSRTATAVPC
jgi:hypothetical protein